MVKLQRRIQRWADRFIDPRLGNVLHGSAANIMFRVIMGLGSMLAIPVLLGYLGPALFGQWVLITTTIYIFGTLDLGFPQILVNEIARLKVLNEISKIYSLLFLILVILVLGFSGIYLGINFFSKIVPIVIPTHSVGLLVSIPLALIITNMIAPLRIGLEQAHKNGIYGSLGAILNLVFI